MAQGKRGAAVSRAAGDAGKEEHRSNAPESDSDILCMQLAMPNLKSHTNTCQEPNEMVPKLFGPIRERYESRPGGYTRVLRIEPLKEDQAESAILELVDGPRDLRFAMTAKTLAQMPASKQFSEKTAENVKKVTRFREDGVEQLRDMVSRMRMGKERRIDDRVLPYPKKVYPEIKMKRDMHYYEDAVHYRLPNPLVKTKRKVRAKAQEPEQDIVSGSELGNTQPSAQAS
jgi:large subunit ribosomal protein L17